VAKLLIFLKIKKNSKEKKIIQKIQKLTRNTPSNVVTTTLTNEKDLIASNFSK